MKTRRTLLTTAMLSGVLMLAGGSAYTQEESLPAAFPPPNCLPGIATAFNANKATYTLLLNTLSPHTTALKNQLALVTNQATYATLLATAHSIANSVTNGRMVVTLPDGTAVLDTSLPDDPNNHLAKGNSYAHFQAKTVNENLNTRVAIMTAQMWACGVGIETKLSTTIGVKEIYVALRLGSHLDSIGTARLSTH